MLKRLKILKTIPIFVKFAKQPLQGNKELCFKQGNGFEHDCYWPIGRFDDESTDFCISFFDANNAFNLPIGDLDLIIFASVVHQRMQQLKFCTRHNQAIS